MSFIADHIRAAYHDKQTHVVLFSSTAIALYGYDQGMMALVNGKREFLLQVLFWIALSFQTG